MDFNATIDLIVKDLDEARKIIDDLKKYPGVPVFQVELAKSKCKSAGEVITLLKGFTDSLPAAKEEPIIQAYEQKLEQQIELDEDVKDTAITDSIDAAVEEKKTDVEPDEIPFPPIEVKEELKNKPQKKAGSSIMADKFSHMSNRFNEQLDTRKNKEDISAILKTKPLENLSKAIGINDKFLFIREIFNGNENNYNQAINKLEKIKDLNEAKEIIMSFSDSDEENIITDQLLGLVKRKLLINE